MSTPVFAYLDGTDTEPEPFEDPVETETPESPLTVAPPTSLPKSTSSTLVPILRLTTRMAVRVPPVMSPSLSTSTAEVAAMSKSVFHKRFRSSHVISSYLSPPDLPSRKRYQGMFELIEDDEEDGDEEDKEIEESLDSDSVSEDAEDEGPTVEDEETAAGDEGLAAGDEGPDMGVESCGLNDEIRGLDDDGHSVESDGLGLGEEEEPVPEGPGADSMVYIDDPTYPPPAPHVQTSPSPEWTLGSLPISLSHSIVPSPISSPMIPLTAPSPVATPATAETEGFLTELEAQVEMQRGLFVIHAVRLGGSIAPALFERYDRDIGELFTRSGVVRDEIFSQRYRFRILEHEQERVVVTFGALWRPVLALESWAGQMDAQRAALWHAISDT
ncbi:hypothetical protein Tco_0776838 [Tanacetum coccineum]